MPQFRRQFYPSSVHDSSGHDCDFPYNMRSYIQPRQVQMIGPVRYDGTLQEVNADYVAEVQTFFDLLVGVDSLKGMADRLELVKSWIACDGSRCAEFVIKDAEPGARIQVRECDDLNWENEEQFLFFYFPEDDYNNDPTSCAHEIGDTVVLWNFEGYTLPIRSDDLLNPQQRILRDLLAEVCYTHLRQPAG